LKWNVDLYKKDLVFFTLNLIFLLMLWTMFNIQQEKNEIIINNVKNYEKTALKNANISIFSYMKTTAKKEGITLEQLLMDENFRKTIYMFLDQMDNKYVDDVEIFYKKPNKPPLVLEQNKIDKKTISSIVNKKNQEGFFKDQNFYYNRFKDGDANIVFINRVKGNIANIRKEQKIQQLKFAKASIIFLFLINIIFLMVRIYMKKEFYNQELNVYNKKTINLIHLNQKTTNGLILVNIDDLRKINKIDKKYGDEAIKVTAAAIKKACKRKIEIIYNENGEFLIIVKNTSKEEISKIIQKIDENIKKMGKDKNKIEFKYDLSVSTAAVVEKTDNIFGMLEKAKEVLMEVKKKQKGGFLTFNKKDKSIKKEVLVDLIHNNCLFFQFQPILIKTKDFDEIIFESLARFKNDDGDIFYPDQFINIIKKDFSLNIEFTKQVIMNIFQTVLKYDKLHFSFNIDVFLIENYKIMDLFFEFYDNHSDETNRVMIEILETDEINSYNEINKVIKRLRNWGYKVAIDDFGSGYSNFSHILNLDVDYIKIDGGIIKNIIENKESSIVTQAMILISNGINIPLIAEFVANKEIYDKIKSYGITNIQGYFLSPPMDSPTCDEKCLKNLQ